MAIIGVHALLYTSEPEAVRSVLGDVFGWKSVDAGGGWLIFAAPPAEVAVHPAEGLSADGSGRHELALICDDLEATVAELRQRGLDVGTDFGDQRWGRTTTITLPGGVDVMLYEPRHPTAI